jgi:hypothetical protein
MTNNEVLVHSLTSSKVLLHRYADDLSPQEFLHRPAAKANCTAWLIGHLTLSDRNALKAFGVQKLPQLPDGFDKRFSRDAGCPDAAEFGDVSILLALFDKHREALIDAVKSASADQLSKTLEKPLPVFRTLGELASFMALHTALHAGQITIIRRSLGRPLIV